MRASGGPPRLSGARAALVTSAVAFVALTVLAATGAVASLDRRVTVWIFGWPSAWRGTMRAVWRLATRRVALVWIALALVVWRRPQPAVAMTAAGLAAWGLALATKEIVGRARPTAELLGARARDPLLGHGYPSAHAALAAALLVPVMVVAPRWARPILAVAVLLVAVSRVYSGAQFALDSLGGLALGIMCGSGALVVFSHFRPRLQT
jgi:membrane-associated phospholipid phosphatase